MYNDGRYFFRSPGWHENDAAWKASQVLSLLSKRNFRRTSIALPYQACHADPAKP